jgi:hypothetical protein
MNTDFERVRQIFMTIVEKPSSEWTALLDAACGTDTELRRQVTPLLKAHVGPAHVCKSERGKGGPPLRFFLQTRLAAAVRPKGISR